MPESPRDSTPQPEPAQYWTWIKVVRRARLGFYDSPRRDPKKWVSSKVVQHIALVAVTYGDYPDGTSIRPSVGRLARVCDADERTVRACLKRLVDLELLTLVREHRHPGRGGGEGRPAEYRLSMPTHLLERIAHLDPDERELIVPGGADMPPERKARQKKAGAAPADPKTTGAAPGDRQSPGAARTGSGSNPVDNPAMPGAARSDSPPHTQDDAETPGAAPETPGAARRNDGCSTRPPGQGPTQQPNHDLASRNPRAEVEVCAPAREQPSARTERFTVIHGGGGVCGDCGAALDPDGTCFVCSSHKPASNGWH